MKKFLYVILICITLIACIGMASAEEYRGSAQGKLISQGEFPEVRKYYSRASTDALEDYLVPQLAAGKAKIDISKYKMPIVDFLNFYWDMLNHHPELFHVYQYVYYSYDGSGRITTIEPDYLFTGDELKKRLAEFNSTLSDIVEYASTASTDVGKLLRINDYFCANYQYDETYSIYRPDLLFSKKTGVCQAYTLAYAAVLNQFDIENTFAQSDPMNHIWNMVKLDGQWYHIDVTWNDPVPDGPMCARHEYFLLSDNGFPYNDHYAWTSEVSATSTKYDKYFWRSLDAPLAVSGSNIYYYNAMPQDYQKRIIYKYDCLTEKSTAIHSFNVTSYMYGYMAIAADSSSVYYGDGNKLYSIGVDGGKPTVIHSFGSSDRIWAAMRDGGTIKLLLGWGSGAKIITMELPGWSGDMDILPAICEVTAGKTVQLKLVSAENPEMTISGGYWTSADTNIATVNSSGLVTGKNGGIVRITAARGDAEAEATVIVHGEQLLEIPEDTKFIAAEAFMGVAAHEISIPHGVESIGNKAFADCKDLKLAVIPETVLSIGKDAFKGCGEDLVLLVHVPSAAYDYAVANGIETIQIG